MFVKYFFLCIVLIFLFLVSNNLYMGFTICTLRITCLISFILLLPSLLIGLLVGDSPPVHSSIDFV